MEGKNIMTDEELEQTIQELTESIDKLSSTEKPLTEEEKEGKRILLIKREYLQRIKKAREKNDKAEELTLTKNYGLFTALGEKHPFLMHFVKSSKFGLDFF